MQINFSVGADKASHTCSLSHLTQPTLAATEDVTSLSGSLTVLKKYPPIIRSLRAPALTRKVSVLW